MPSPARFPISFEPAYAALSRSLFISPDDSYVEIDGGEVAVRMAWAFRAQLQVSVADPGALAAALTG